MQNYPEDRDALIDACGFWSIGIFALEHFAEYTTKPYGRHHQPIFEVIDRGEQGAWRNILAPRGSAKSTCLAIIYPIHAIYYKDAYRTLGMEPYDYIIIVTNTATLAESRVWNIMRKMSGHKPFQHLIGEERWGIELCLTSNNTLLQPNSRGGEIRGSLFEHYRPDLIICDDLDDSENVNNPDIREKDQLWFDTDLLQAGRQDEKTNVIVVDTVKHEESVASLLQNRTRWRTEFFRAIEHPEDLWHPTAENLWKEWERIYNDMRMKPKERYDKSTQYFNDNRDVMMEGVQHLWEESLTYLQIRQKICELGYFAVLREYQNSTRDPSRAIFDMDTALYFDPVQEGFLRSDKVLVRWDEMTGATIFLDWAGGKDIVDNAFAAVVAVIWVRLPGTREERTESIMDGVHGYVFRADVRRIGMDAQINACLDMYNMVKSNIRTHNFNIRLGIEGFVIDLWKAQQDAIERAFIAERERRGLQDLFIQWLPRLTNKFDRIDALQPLIRNGWLIFNNTLDNEFMKQMYLYPTGDFLDAPDALEGACQLRIAKFESEREATRRQRREQEKQFKIQI